jgi:hypothetical protein
MTMTSCRRGRFEVLLFSSAVMLGACGGSSGGGQGSGGQAGSSTPAGTGGIGGSNGSGGSTASGLGGSAATGGTLGGGTGGGPSLDASAADTSDTGIGRDADAVDAPAGVDATGGTGGSSGTGGAGQGGDAGTGGTGGSSGIDGAGQGGDAGTGGAGGAAGATTCTPTALTDTVFDHWDQVGNYLATDGTNVYWADLLTGNTTARLNRVPVAGGSAITMAYEEGIASASFYTLLAIDRTNVYFNPYSILSSIGYGGTGSVLWAIPKGAGPATQPSGTAMCYSTWSSENGGKPCPVTQYGGTLLSTGGLDADKSKYVGTDFVSGLISTGSEVCWVDGSQTELRCVSVAGGDPVTLVKVLPGFYPSPIATDGKNVLYRYAGGTLVDIMSVPIAGGNPVKIGSYGSNGGINGFFLVNAGYLYWAPTNSTNQDTILKMPTTGGTPEVLASNQTVYRSTYAATDGKNLYWWGHATDGLRQIMKVSVNGGVSTVVVKDGTENINVLSVAVDDTNVYWMHPPYMYKCPK